MILESVASEGLLSIKGIGLLLIHIVSINPTSQQDSAVVLTSPQ